MKFGIGAQLVSIATALVVVPIAVFFFWVENTAEDVVLKHEVLDLGDETRLNASALLSEVYTLRGDVERLANELATQDLAKQDLQTLEKLCRGNYYQPNYLWLEIVAIDNENSKETNVALHPPGMSIANRDEFLARVKAHLPNSERNRTIVSEILRVSVEIEMKREDSQPSKDLSQDHKEGLPREQRIGGSSRTSSKMVNIVWTGTHLPRNERNPYDIVVIGALDLDADLPVDVMCNGDRRSPLSQINGSPRHLALLANEPEIGETRPRLMCPDDAGLQLLQHEKQLVDQFEKLYRKRDELIDECNDLLKKHGGRMPPVEPRQVIPLDEEVEVNLKEPLWFQQSEPIPPELQQVAADTVARLAQAVSTGQRIGRLSGGVRQVRLLAQDKKELVALREGIDSELRKQKVHVGWQTEVSCERCYVRFALFPIRSGDLELKGFKKYYGLAQVAFSEEMNADVGQTMWHLAWWGGVFVVLVAVLGVACLRYFTRPLKQITAAAKGVADADLGVDPAVSNWKTNVWSVLNQLPVKRHDEIGVLARAFRQMLDEVVKGHERLRKWNANLDRLVKERTGELEQANEELRAARDKADELNRAKDAFLATVGHELRNPLNQVSGFCQLLELTDLSEEQRSDLQKIRSAASQQLALINDILDYQKIILGGITLEPEDFQVSELVAEVGDAMELQARENRNRLEVHCDDSAGDLHADKQRVRQVLLNLLSNASKFTLDGTVGLRASRIRGIDGDVIQFDVTDTGRGMTPEELAKLFTPFTKLAARQGNRSGTGLGLVISKGFCVMMHGDITVESEFGKGSKFTVRLPADTTVGHVARPGSETKETPTEVKPKAEKDPVAERARPTPLPGKCSEVAERVKEQLPAASARIVLVVDDDPNVREMMHRHLESQGFRVISAANGLEGLEVAKRMRPAVITLDAIMPGLDGWAVLAALRTDEETAKIPVVMVTITDDERRGYTLGAAEFITKPIDWGQLSTVLAKYTGNKRRRSVLVVDDDPRDREILRRNLEGDGWDVLEAEHGKAALEVLANERPAAILLDLMMPVMDGFEFLAEYCRLAEWLSTPVVVITAKDPTPEELERLEGSVVHVLQKGQYSNEELLREIHRRVDRHILADTREMKEQHDA